ncbi:hypothetical protein N9L33_03950 [Nitrospinae bacterium]|nr:hypothetical protein [Nitrospinota bacterium]
MELTTQLRKHPAFQTLEFFIMVTGKNEVNLFPGIMDQTLNYLPE